MNSLEEVKYIYNLLLNIKHYSVIGSNEVKEQLDDTLNQLQRILIQHGAYPVIDDVNGTLIKEVQDKDGESSELTV